MTGIVFDILSHDFEARLYNLFSQVDIQSKYIPHISHFPHIAWDRRGRGSTSV